MAIWGKETGGKATAAHLVYVGCVGTQNQPKNPENFLPAAKCYSHMWIRTLCETHLCAVYEY